MINLFSFSFCDAWWLAWLLPFLLGLALGYLLWARYKAMAEGLQNDINSLNLNISGLESDLTACRKARAEADGNVSLLSGRIKEMEVGLIGKTSGAKQVAKAGTSAASFIAGVKTGSSTSDKWAVAIGDNKLQIIEGIGPKMEEVLTENGITNFSQLAASTPESLREILNKYGDKYRIIDPNTWPLQAGFAADKKWNDLIALQKTLDTGRSDTVTDGHTDAKLEKWLIKFGLLRRWKQDDLKAIEGIGPKIEGLLHNAEIKTWRQLADTSVAKIQEILDAAGPRFSLAEPGTWPNQSALAADGKWDDLQAYQDELNAGKPK